MAEPCGAGSQPRLNLPFALTAQPRPSEATTPESAYDHPELTWDRPQLAHVASGGRLISRQVTLTDSAIRSAKHTRCDGESGGDAGV